MLGQTTSTSDASSCWPLEEQPQPAHSPGPGGDPFSFFSPSLGCFLTGRAIRYFTSLLYPKLFDFCTSPIPPICLFLWIASVPVRLPGSAHHIHPSTRNLALALPLAWRSGCLLFRLSQSSQPDQGLPQPSQKEPSKAQQSKAALPTRSSFVSVTRTARDCSSPSKSIPSQNRRFPLFDFITIIITSNPNAAAPQPFTLFGPPLDLYRTRKRGAVQSLDPLKIIETAVHQASSCPERLPTWRTTAITMATIAMACRTSAKTQQAFVTSSLLLLLHAAPHLPICLRPLQKFPPRSLP